MSSVASTVPQDGQHPDGDGGLSAGVAGRRPRRTVPFGGSHERGTPAGVRRPQVPITGPSVQPVEPCSLSCRCGSAVAPTFLVHFPVA